MAFVTPPETADATSAQRAADAKLSRALDELIAMPDGPPGAIAVVQRGDRVRVFSAGVAEVGTDRRPMATDHMRIASTSKAFSGAVALSLVAQGALSLEDTIAQRLPALPAAWGAVTLRQLLNHTSGLPGYTGNPAAQQAIAGSLTVAPPPEQLLEFVKNEPLAFSPGSSYAYSNSDNIAVGLMAQDATGRSYEDGLAEHVYGPLALQQTSLPTGPEIPKPYVHGYDHEANSAPEDISEVFASGWAWASGGVISTPHDLNRFIRGYVGGALFDADLQAQHRQFVSGGSDPTGPGVNSAGLALFRYETRCGTVLGHTGNIFGYTQFMAASADGTRSATMSINVQRTQHSEGQAGAVFEALRNAEDLAVCAAVV